MLKPSRPLENFPDHSETFQTIPELSSPSGNFPDHSTELQIQQIQSNIRSKWWPIYQFSSFPDHLDTFQILRQLSRPSRNFPDHLNIFQTTQKLLGPSRHFLDPPEAFQTVWKFAVQFQERAKTFWSAMPTRRRGFWDSASSNPNYKVSEFVL